MFIATFELPHEAIALQQTFQRVPDLELEAERIAAHSTHWTMPCLWAASTDFDAVDAALADDPTVTEIVGAHAFAEEKYYQLEWDDTVVDRIDQFVDQEASVLEASATADGWRVQFRFVSREQFEQFRQTLHEADCSFDLLDITEPGTPHQSIGTLTPDQREALVAAVEHGYYTIPRETTADDLAAGLGISQQALSERLRRGVDNLVEATLMTTAEAADAGEPAY